MPRYQTGLPSVLAVSALVLTLASLLTLASCGPADVARLRQNYAAELNSWFKEETPAAAEAMITVEGEAEGPAQGGPAPSGDGDAGEEMPTEIAETVVVSQKVTLDILVKHKGGGTLPGITLDIYQADSNGQEKQNWKRWVDTSDLAVGKQFTQTLEGVTLEEGDQFAVEVREYVPPEERDEYREFASPPAS